MPTRLFTGTAGAARIGAVAIILAVLSGCVVPTPNALDVQSPRANISETQFVDFKPTSTRRADVLLRLGNPTDRIDDDRFFVYDWRTIDVIWLFCYQNCIGGPIARTANLLVFEFDAANRLVEMRRIEAGDHGAASDRLQKWIESRGGTTGREPALEAPVSDAESNRPADPSATPK